MISLDRQPSTALPPIPSSGRPPSRFYYIDPMGLPDPADLVLAVSRAAAMGFDAILMPPPWPTGIEANRLLPSGFERVHPMLGGQSASHYITALAAICDDHGLKLLLDLDVSQVAVTCDGDVPWAERQSTGPVLDPRHIQSPDHRYLHAEAAPAWWAERVEAWAAAGLGGLRLLGLEQAARANLVSALRAVSSRFVLIAWTPGLAPHMPMELAGVDYVCSSLPWWDGEADWFWQEHARLSRIAPVLACPEAPFGPRVAATVKVPGLLLPTLRRGAAMARALGDAWMMPAGYETGTRRGMVVEAQSRIAADTPVDLAAHVTALNAQVAAPGHIHILAGVGQDILGVLRTDTADQRFATRAALTLINASVTQTAEFTSETVLRQVSADLTPFEEPDGTVVETGIALTLRPGFTLLMTAVAASRPADRPPIAAAAASRAAAGPRVAIEAPSPCVDNGTLPVKRQVGELVMVVVDVVCDGHDKLGVALLWRGPGDATWHEARMAPIGNDRYSAGIPLTRIGAWEYTVHAWRDAFASYRDELAKKVTAGLNVALELREGVALLSHTASRSPGPIATAMAPMLTQLTAADDAGRTEQLLSSELAAFMLRADDRPRAASLPNPVRIDAEREGAGFAAWYEVFPRSLSGDPARHGTFGDVETHLARVAAMGFDVLYFPPIHPIGRVNRKGRNNTLTPADDDPGSPYAIGSAEGGHDVLHPELGTLADFQHLIHAAAEHRLEIAIDFAIQCSPDHPWLKQHRDWFAWRPDGSIKYAENPPKRYEDIVNVDFYADGAIPGLWVALANVVAFWCEQGIRLFRVDNPHTKPFPFWQWMIGEIRSRYPDAVFLAEAFTRPKVMYRLAKVGFSQSYTYFTWRETRREMETYLTELSQPGPRDFFRPHFFVNTPDINPVYLQGASRSAYLIRAALAATLSGLWGVYNGFELCEGTPVPGKEEYLDSEKYQLRVWDWDRPGNIVAEITALNHMRRFNPALRTHLNTIFLPSADAEITVFEKATTDRGNVVIVAISFDAANDRQSTFEFPFWHWQATEDTEFVAENLVTGARETWRGKYQTARLTAAQPYAVWHVRTA